MSAKEIYFLPGRRSKIDEGTGELILNLGVNVVGREILGDFEVYPIKKQLELICNDIKSNFWGKEHKIIGRSYGGYLAMHALMEFLPQKYPGKVLLLSPVLGRSDTKVLNYGSRPPRANKILEYAKAGYLEGLDIEIYTGDKDGGCDYTLAEEIFSYIKSSKLHIVKGATHYFDEKLTINILKDFLKV
jgi:pimeloyl-ACP methyl ester carboxylesterase